MSLALHRRHFLATVACAAGLGLGLAPAAFAQDWPTGPLHVYVGFPAGSSPDTIARLIAEPLAKELGQPVIVENKPGAGGVIGVQQMLAQNKDGHSFGVTINGPLTTSQRLIDDIGYDATTDIAPVALIATSPLVLAVSSEFAAQDLESYVAAAKAEPEAVSYGSVGQGSGAHLTAVLFGMDAGVELFHIPFQSYAEVTTALIGGEIDSGFMAPSAALPFVQSGQLKMLGVTSAEPFAQIADVPVIAGQAGLPADFRAELWNAFIAPAGTDPAVIARLNTEVTKIVNSDDVREKLLAMGWQSANGMPEDLAARISEDTKVWSRALDTAAQQQ